MYKIIKPIPRELINSEREVDINYYTVGDIIEYNEWLGTWGKRLDTYQQRRLTKDVIDKYTHIFEVIK